MSLAQCTTVERALWLALALLIGLLIAVSALATQRPRFNALVYLTSDQVDELAELRAQGGPEPGVAVRTAVAEYLTRQRTLATATVKEED